MTYLLGFLIMKQFLFLEFLLWNYLEQEEHQDKDRRIYEIMFSFNGKSCDELVGSPCILFNYPA